MEEDNRYFNPSYTLINMSALTPEVCDEIIAMFDNAEETEVQFDIDPDDPMKVMPVDEENESCLKYQDRLGRWLYCIGGDNPDFPLLEDMIQPVLPKTEDFGQISYVSIIVYPEGTHMPMHRDEADIGDTGTVVFNLNSDFTGGEFVVDGHIIKPFEGQMIAFNNSTERFHGVLPVLGDERISLCLWFTRVDEDLDLPDYPDEVNRVHLPEDYERPQTEDDGVEKKKFQRFHIKE